MGSEKPKGRQKAPNVRAVSNVIVTDENFPDVDKTHILQFGQFIDHDMVHVPVFNTKSNQIFES